MSEEVKRQSAADEQSVEQDQQVDSTSQTADEQSTDDVTAAADGSSTGFDGLDVDIAGQSGESRSFFQRHPFLVYTSERLGVLIIAFAICYLLGARGILLILLAFLISGFASYILFAGQRDTVGQRMGGYFSRMNQRIEASTKSEDEYVDSLVEESASSATDAKSRPAEDPASSKRADDKNADGPEPVEQVDLTDKPDQEHSK